MVIGRFGAISCLLAAAACSTSARQQDADSGVIGQADGASPGVDDAGPPEASVAAVAAFAGCTLDPGAPQGVVNAGATEDPIGADKFTLAMALDGFPSGTGVLKAAIETEKSTIVCTLDDAKAPISVANFIGLARGTRPFMAANRWKLGRFYDGLIWHRVVPGFVIQGGDPLGTGAGGPGYSLPEENHVPEVLGALAMAASDAPSGSQFYIVVGRGPDSKYNVFGNCTTEAAVEIAKVARDGRDKPTTAVHMQTISIARCPKG